MNIVRHAARVQSQCPSCVLKRTDTGKSGSPHTWRARWESVAASGKATQPSWCARSDFIFRTVQDTPSGAENTRCNTDKWQVCLMLGMFRRRAGTHGTLSRRNVCRNVKVFFCVAERVVNWDRHTRGLAKHRRLISYVFELEWTRVVSVLCVAYFLACCVIVPTACQSWHSEPPFLWDFSSDKRSQVFRRLAVTFHRIGPPFVFQTGLQ